MGGYDQRTIILLFDVRFDVACICLVFHSNNDIPGKAFTVMVDLW